MRSRSGAFGFVAGVLLTVLVGVVWIHFAHPTPAVSQVNAPAILHQIEGLQQLVSVKSTVQKVVGLEEKKYPLGAERILLFVQAQVLAGVDLAELTPANVQVFSARRVRINLPSPRILQTVIDDKQTKVWDRSITWWTPWVPYNPDLERQARLAALDEIDKAAIEGGILDLARRNAETAIREFLETTGVKASVASAT
ncbi:MAG TPA: DUF4230 domain-containing protein [Bryobacteraceae bacterium]